MLYFVAPGYVVLGLALIIVSNYAYSMGESFIAAFLPELGPPAALGKISGFGWALGYLGGLFAAGFTLLVLGEATADNFSRIRFVGPFAAAFSLWPPSRRLCGCKSAARLSRPTSRTDTLPASECWQPSGICATLKT